MAHLSFNWLLASMKGKACRHDEVYTKTNKQTGKSYAVKLCNPADPTKATAAQKTQRSKFGVISRAVSAWLETEKAKEGGDGSVAYNKALAAYRSQHKIGSFRGFVMSKYVTYDAATKQVTITVGGTSATVAGGSNGSNGSNVPGGSNGSNGSSGSSGGEIDSDL